MSQPINRIASGLLSLFQIKSQGDNPNRFEDAVRPGLEMSNHYYTSLGLKSTTEVQVDVDDTDLATKVAEISIPDNEIWIVRAIDVDWICTTAVATQFLTCCIRLDSLGGAGTTGIFFADSDKDWLSLTSTMVINYTFFATQAFDNPLFLPGGTNISAYVSRATGANQKWDVRTRVLHYTIEK